MKINSNLPDINAAVYNGNRVERHPFRDVLTGNFLETKRDMKFVPDRDFPAELLIPADGSISGKDGIFSVTINLSPFKFDGEQINQSLIIKDVPLPATSVDELLNKEFTFPNNPEDGYVETSIYIWSVHNPIDVLKMKFTDATSGVIECSFDMKFVFEFENLEKTLVVSLKIKD